MTPFAGRNGVGHNGAVASGATSETGRSALRGPLLSLLIQQQQPTHAYKLYVLINQWLPTWHVVRGTVADLLNELEAEGVIRSSQEPRKVYYPGPRAAQALDAWMGKVVSQPPVREELHAMILCSSRRHAPTLLRALDTYQKECSAQLSESQGGETNSGSWRSLTINLVRAAADDHWNAKIAWAISTQERIRAHLAQAEPPDAGLG